MEDVKITEAHEDAKSAPQSQESEALDEKHVEATSILDGETSEIVDVAFDNPSRPKPAAQVKLVEHDTYAPIRRIPQNFRPAYSAVCKTKGISGKVSGPLIGKVWKHYQSWQLPNNTDQSIISVCIDQCLTEKKGKPELKPTGKNIRPVAEPKGEKPELGSAYFKFSLDVKQVAYLVQAGVLRPGTKKVHGGAWHSHPVGASLRTHAEALMFRRARQIATVRVGGHVRFCEIGGNPRRRASDLDTWCCNPMLSVRDVGRHQSYDETLVENKALERWCECSSTDWIKAAHKGVVGCCPKAQVFFAGVQPAAFLMVDTIYYIPPAEIAELCNLASANVLYSYQWTFDNVEGSLAAGEMTYKVSGDTVDVRNNDGQGFLYSHDALLWLRKQQQKFTIGDKERWMVWNVRDTLGPAHECPSIISFSLVDRPLLTAKPSARRDQLRSLSAYGEIDFSGRPHPAGVLDPHMVTLESQIKKVYSYGSDLQVELNGHGFVSVPKVVVNKVATLMAGQPRDAKSWQACLGRANKVLEDTSMPLTRDDYPTLVTVCALLGYWATFDTDVLAVQAAIGGVAQNIERKYYNTLLEQFDYTVQTYIYSHLRTLAKWVQNNHIAAVLIMFLLYLTTVRAETNATHVFNTVYEYFAERTAGIANVSHADIYGAIGSWANMSAWNETWHSWEPTVAVELNTTIVDDVRAACSAAVGDGLSVGATVYSWFQGAGNYTCCGIEVDRAHELGTFIPQFLYLPSVWFAAIIIALSPLPVTMGVQTMVMTAILATHRETWRCILLFEISFISRITPLVLMARVALARGEVNEIKLVLLSIFMNWFNAAALFVTADPHAPLRLPRFWEQAICWFLWAIYALFRSYRVAYTICQHGKKLKSHYGTVIVRRLELKPCQPKLALVQHGPVAMPVAFIPQACQHNAVVALSNRAFYSPVAREDIDEDAWDFDTLVRENLSVLSLLGLGRKDPTFRPFDYKHLISFDDWVARFPAPRRDYLRKVKLAMRSWKPTLKPTCFVKAETMKKADSDPRNIMCPCPEYLVTYGPIHYTFQKWLAARWRLRKNRDHNIVYVTGMTAEQIGEIHDYAISRGLIPVASDGNRFDGSIIKVMMLFVWELVMYCGMRTCDAISILLKVEYKGTDFTRNVYFESKDGRQPSGSLDTNWGNTIVNGVNHSVVLKECGSTVDLIMVGSDDCVVYTNSPILYRHKLQDSIFRGIEYSVVPEGQVPDFFSCWFYPTQDGTILGPKIGKVLARGFWTRANRLDAKHARQIAFSLYHRACHVPILSQLAINVLEKTKHVAGSEVHEQHKIRLRKLRSIDEVTRLWVCEHYKLTLLQLRQLEEFVLNCPLNTVFQDCHPSIARAVADMVAADWS